MKILIAIAMLKEAQPVINLLSMKHASTQLNTLFNSPLYYCMFNNHPVYLMTSGKDSLHQTDRLGSGIIPALTDAIQKVTPDILINIGSAGGIYKKGARQGDVYLSHDTFKFHDRLFSPDYFHESYGIGNYPNHSVKYIADALHLKLGIISTGGSMLSSKEEKKQIKKNQATLKDMEAAHIAQVAHIFNIPMFAIKGVTDLIDIHECPQEQFTRNINNLSQILAQTLVDVINLL